MRGSKAKVIRRNVYGDFSIRGKRNYVMSRETGQIMNHPNSPRAVYQRVKRMVKPMDFDEKVWREIGGGGRGFFERFMLYVRGILDKEALKKGREDRR